MKNSIILIALIAVAILFPTNGQAAEEVMPIAQPVVEESSAPMESSVSVAETTLAAPEEISTQNVSDRKSTRLNSSHVSISYAVFCLKKKNNSSSRQPWRDARREENARQP